MKLIQAMKQVKDLQRKGDDLKAKVKQFCADMDFETPVYGTPDKQAKQIAEWIQAHSDICKEILRLRIAIQRTNLTTNVTITLPIAFAGGYHEKDITKTVAEWIHRRRDLATNEMAMWAALTDRGLKDSRTTTTTGQMIDCRVRRYFDPATKDRFMEMFRNEPHTIDSNLEVVNATTDIIE